ncbi:hypothetical protein EV421DRAFT_1828558 [Armillaria borealis]|uniref:Uncharacterized protein n=1 Tax=Armillaria borealis TaxID=47425 RepID=A0AA39J8J1_9AGAR|nr:hypothetical protein EV421DRAFT_1828558 [Armillaria borealis]
MANTTTNEAARPSNLNAVNLRTTEEQFDEVRKRMTTSEHEWSKESLTFKYIAAHEPFTALPVHYLRFTGCALLPPKFALGIGLARRLVPNEPVEDSSMLLTTLIRRLRDRTNLNVRATPVRSKEVGFVFYIAPAQRDIMNAMLREINWRDNIKCTAKTTIDPYCIVIHRLKYSNFDEKPHHTP